MNDNDTDRVLLARLELGTPRMDGEPFGLLGLVEDVAEQMEPRARTKILSLMVFVAPEIPPRVHGGAAALRRVLFNLVDNAIKFTEKGEVVVRAGLVERSTETVAVRIEVCDSGVGLPPEIHAQLNNGRSSGGVGHAGPMGTGTGLAVAHHLVTTMGGTLDVTETSSRGTTVAFTVPLKPAAEETAVDAGGDAERQLHVLVVDDNQTHREILLRYLTYWGIRTDSAATGDEALALLQHAVADDDPFQLAILDLAMPGMDGFALAHAIRRDTALGGIRLILLTAFDERGQGELALREGFAAYLTKPVKHAHLFETIRGLFLMATDVVDRTPAASAPGP